MHFAAQNYDVEMTSLLLSHGATIDIKDGNGNTPLFRAVFESQGRGELITLLREKGADPFIKNNHGNSPLVLAYKIANYDTKQYFQDLPKP